MPFPATDGRVGCDGDADWVEPVVAVDNSYRPHGLPDAMWVMGLQHLQAHCAQLAREAEGSAAAGLPSQSVFGDYEFFASRSDYNAE